MAWVDGKIVASFSFVDDDLAEASQSVNFPSDTTLAEAYAFADDYVVLLGGVSDCVIQNYKITQERYDDTYPQAPAGSDVEVKGVLKLRTADNGVKTFSWPGVLESLLINNITPASTYINLAAPAIAALVSAVLTGLDGVQPSTHYGADLLAVVEAYKKHTASQKSRMHRG